MNKNKIKIGYFSSWPILGDGIATFCYDLAHAFAESSRNKDWKFIRVKWLGQRRILDREKMLFTVKSNKKIDYKKAAIKVNNSNIDFLIIQHIYGIYGGKWGDYILDFIENLEKPFLVVLHSIPMHPTQPALLYRQYILKEIAKYANGFVVMTEISKSFLVNKLGISKEKVFFIPHGAPKFNKINKSKTKKIFSLQNKKILFTYSLLHPKKGFDNIIKAMPLILQKFPETQLIIAGERHKGMSQNSMPYDVFLKNLVKKLGVNKNVKIINKFLFTKDLGLFLQISDIFLNPQYELALHSSGTLSYALAAGKVCVATPFYHAKEVVDKKMGILVPVKDYRAIAKAVINLFEDKKKFKFFENNVKKYRKEIFWDNIAQRYLEIIQTLCE